MREHLIIACLIVLLEAWFGVGLFGRGVGLFGAMGFVVLAVTDKQRRSQHLRNATVYAILLVVTIVLLSENAKLAKRRATLVISAVNLYHSEHGQYPTDLNELVPEYLPSIPHAGFTRISREFHYYNGRPQLYFAGMFHGIFVYDFVTRSWTTNE